MTLKGTCWSLTNNIQSRIASRQPRGVVIFAPMKRVWDLNWLLISNSVNKTNYTRHNPDREAGWGMRPYSLQILVMHHFLSPSLEGCGQGELSWCRESPEIELAVKKSTNWRSALNFLSVPLISYPLASFSIRKCEMPPWCFTDSERFHLVA